MEVSMADDMDGIPEDVRKAGEEAEAKAKELMDGRKARKAAAAANPAPVTAPPAPPAQDPTPNPDPQGQGEDQPELTQGVDASIIPGESQGRGSAVEDENRRLKHELSTVHGRLGAVMEKMRDLESKLAAPRPQADPAPAEVPPPVGSPGYLDWVTEDMKARYGEDFFPMVARLAEDVVRRENRAMREQMSTEQKRNLAQLEREMSAERFWSDVDRMAPGARAINGRPANPESGDPGERCAEGWGRFLDQPVRAGSTLTRRNEAVHALQTGNARAFAALVEEFKATRPDVYGSENESTRPRVSVRAQTVPRSVRGSVPPPADGRRRVIPKSEFDQFQELANAGKLTPEEADKKMLEYSLALKEGRVDVSR